MVTAGVFMVARLSPLFELAPLVLDFVTVIGATTAIFAATVGLTQFDISASSPTRPVLSWLHVLRRRCRSLRCRDLPPDDPRLLQGAAVPRGRFGHPRHAPRAGYAQNGRDLAQGARDLRLHGGSVRWRWPGSGSCSCSAPPGSALPASIPRMPSSRPRTQPIRWSVTSPSWGSRRRSSTAFYSGRLLFLTFHGSEPGDQHTFDHAHESPLVMIGPLVILAIGAVLAGGVAYPWLEGGHHAYEAGKHAKEATDGATFWAGLGGQGPRPDRQDAQVCGVGKSPAAGDGGLRPRAEWRCSTW